MDPGTSLQSIYSPNIVTKRTSIMEYVSLESKRMPARPCPRPGANLRSVGTNNSTISQQNYFGATGRITRCRTHLLGRRSRRGICGTPRSNHRQTLPSKTHRLCPQSKLTPIGEAAIRSHHVLRPTLDLLM
jgi:hypothetical protein